MSPKLDGSPIISGMSSVGTHHSGGHECPPYADDTADCDMLTALGQYQHDKGFYRREDAVFWVPHQRRVGKMVEFDRIHNHC